MPLCPQITMTPVPVTTSGITMYYVKPVIFPSTATASSVIGTLYHATAPVAYTIGQLWADSAHGNKLYRCSAVGTITNAVGSGSTVTFTTDAPHGLTVGQLISIAEVDPTAYNLEGVTVATAPTTTTFTVASSATGTYVEGGWVAGWTAVQDAGIQTAITTANAAAATASTAQSTADGKNKIYRQASQPTGGTYAEGDLWFDTSNNNRFSRFTSGAWSAFTLGTNAVANLNASVITAGTIDASTITVSNINAGNIATGYLSGDRIQAGAIDASKITTGTLGASVVYAGSVSADNITSGTMSAARISGGTISSSLIDTSQEVRSALYVKTPYLNCTSVAYIGTVAGYPSGSGVIISDSGGVSIQSATTHTANTTLSSGVYTSSGFYNAGLSGRSVVVSGSPYQLGSNSSSSRRYKQDIAPATFDASPLLSLPMVQFRYIKEVEAEGDAAAVHTGLIAEEVADAGLEWLIDRDDEGRPDYIYWSERMPQALLQLIQQQQQTIEALEARVAALEGKSS